MGIAERREREREQRRSSILDAAEKLFFDHGVDKTTMDEVADEAELSKGTLYLYFKNKEDLYHAIHFRGMNVLRNMFLEAFESHQKGIDKVRAVGEAYLSFSRKYPNYYDAMMYFEAAEIDVSDQASYAYKCHEASLGVMQIVAGAVEAGMDDGTIRPLMDPKLMAYLLWGQTSGIIHIVSRHYNHWKADPEHGIDPDALLPGFFDFIDKALQVIPDKE